VEASVFKNNTPVSTKYGAGFEWADGTVPKSEVAAVAEATTVATPVGAGVTGAEESTGAKGLSLIASWQYR